jgi:hypothetical protein
MTKTIVFAIVLASACGTIAAFIRIRAQEHELAALRHDIASNQEDDAALKNSRIEQIFAATTAAAAIGRSSTQPLNEHPSESAPATPAPPIPNKPKITSAELQNRFSDFFTKEQVNASWARERANVLTARIEGILPASSTLTGVECHSTLCRIETAHSTIESAKAFMSGSVEHFDTKLTTGASFTTPVGKDSQGRLVIVQYVASEGQNLPRVDEM